MTLRLFTNAMSQISNILSSGGERPQAAAYSVACADLQETYNGLQLSSADQDAFHQISTAEQVNSGSHSVAALAIRANNSAASFFEVQGVIGLFDPIQQQASDAIAEGFFGRIGQDGMIPGISKIRFNDVIRGKDILGVGPSGWVGALPPGTGFISGFNDTSYYDNLSPFSKVVAGIERLLASFTLSVHLSGKLYDPDIFEKLSDTFDKLFEGSVSSRLGRRWYRAFVH